MGVIPQICAYHGREGLIELMSKSVFPLHHYVELQIREFRRYVNCSTVLIFAIASKVVQGVLEVSRRTLSRMVVAVAEHNGCVCIFWFGEFHNFKSVHAEYEDMEPGTLKRKEVIEGN